MKENQSYNTYIKKTAYNKFSTSKKQNPEERKGEERIPKRCKKWCTLKEPSKTWEKRGIVYFDR